MMCDDYGLISARFRRSRRTDHARGHGFKLPVGARVQSAGPMSFYCSPLAQAVARASYKRDSLPDPMAQRNEKIARFKLDREARRWQRLPQRVPEDSRGSPSFAAVISAVPPCFFLYRSPQSSNLLRLSARLATRAGEGTTVRRSPELKGMRCASSPFAPV